MGQENFSENKFELVITCLGGQFERNCSSAFLKTLPIAKPIKMKAWQYQNFQKSRKQFISKITPTKLVTITG